VMRLRFWGPIIVTLAIGGISLGRTEAQSSSVAALTGRVSSQEEGAMEGVLVSAKRSGSKVAVTVVSNEQGQYSFPRARLEPGQYSIRIRAVGYELADPRPVEVDAQTSTTLDLKLRKTQDVSRQLSNGEWLMSMTGTEEQKQNFLGCTKGHYHGIRSAASGSVAARCGSRLARKHMVFRFWLPVPRQARFEDRQNRRISRTPHAFRRAEGSARYRRRSRRQDLDGHDVPGCHCAFRSKHAEVR